MGSLLALNYNIQIYTKLSEIIGITYVNSDSGRQSVLKGVITISSSYFGTFSSTVRLVFMSLSPWSDLKSSLEYFFFKGSGFHFSKCCHTLPFFQKEM